MSDHIDDGKVVRGAIPTMLPVPVKCVLECAIEANLDEVVIIGCALDKEQYLAMSESDTDRILAQLEIAKTTILHARMRRMGLM